MGKEISMSRTGLRRQIVDLKNQLESLMWSSHLEEGVEQIRRVNMNIEELEAQEEEMWVQQSRQNWLAEGDENTAFFSPKSIPKEAHQHC